MKLILLICAIIALASCTEPYSSLPELTPLVRAKIVESGTITHCYLNNEQKWTLQRGDSVWLDVANHRIDDTARYTMKAVLQ